MDLVWLSIFALWMLFVCATRSQQEFVSSYAPNHHDDHGKRLKLAVFGSLIVAAVVGVGLIYLHYTAFGIAWTLALTVVGSVLAAAIWGALSALVGDYLLALVGFLVWPVSALGIYLLLRLYG